MTSLQEKERPPAPAAPGSCAGAVSSESKAKRQVAHRKLMLIPQTGGPVLAMCNLIPKR